MYKNSGINVGNLKISKKAKIIVGENCIISYNVNINADYHNYKDKKILILSQGNLIGAGL